MNTPTPIETDRQSAVTCSALLERERPTIMDGRVIQIATGFEEREAVFGKLYKATGPFEVSASRNAVVVHRAELRDEESLALFLEAVVLSAKRMEMLRSNDCAVRQSPAPETP
jgi:hypothetical protein